MPTTRVDAVRYPDNPRLTEPELESQAKRRRLGRVQLSVDVGGAVSVPPDVLRQLEGRLRKGEELVLYGL